MDFFIQVSEPICLNNFNKEDESLSDALETIFPLLTEKAIIMWKHIPILISYKYDISYMIDDILDMLIAIRTEKHGKMVIHWLPDTFRCDWKISWDEINIKINAEWGGIIGDFEVMLNKNPEVCVGIEDFRNEWKKLLGIVVNSLKECGYKKEQIRNMDKLLTEYNEIRGCGILYKEE